MSAKKNLINDLIVGAAVELEMMDTSDEEGEEILDDLEDDLTVVYLCRYSYQSFVPKSYGFYDDVLLKLDDNRFKKFVRCTRQYFNVILDKIKDDPIFNGVNSDKQFSTFFQLVLVMYRLGSNGDGISIAKNAALFGIGDGGTIDRITARVFKSILALESQYLNWPSEEERTILVHETWDEMPYCIGYSDGTEIEVEEAPVYDKESYYSRSKVYSLKLQGTCDYHLRLRNIVIGYPGSVHDARIFNSCNLALNPQRYFSGEQYLAADSAYRLTRYVITPFRKNTKSPFSAEKIKQFNQFLSSYRVRIEHVFGIMKEILPSLKRLRLRIHDQKSYEFACTWIRVCCIIYNILLPHVDPSEYKFVINAEEEENLDPDSIDIDKEGEAKRNALVEIILE